LPETGSHIFICFSSKDEAIAREVVEFLERDGLRCWISLRDVRPGHNYQEAIVQAIETARGIVFLFSQSSSKSGEIKKELSLGGSDNVPVFPVRLTPIEPTGALRYELAIRQWIDIFPDRQYALARLAQSIKRDLNEPNGPKKAPFAGDSPRIAEKAMARVTPPSSPAHAPIVASGTPQFDAVRSLLARHIGPIAKILIEKAAAEARTTEEFCDRLAAHVTAPAERAAFVSAVRARLSAKA
jgi:hypothetical protein